MLPRHPRKNKKKGGMPWQQITKKQNTTRLFLKKRVDPHIHVLC